MIKSFKSKETARIFARLRSTRLPGDIQQVSYRKLRMLNNAVTLDDLRVPPANRLEKLSGDRAGQYSIRINDQWRICFEWIDGDACNVEIVDLSLGAGNMNEKLNPVHPGEVLLEEFLKPMGLSQNRLSLEIGVHPRRINEIVLGKRRITADTALRLARSFRHITPVLDGIAERL